MAEFFFFYGRLLTWWLYVWWGFLWLNLWKEWRDHAPEKHVESLGIRGGDAGCHLEMWGLRSILGLKEFHAQSRKDIYSAHDWRIYTRAANVDKNWHSRSDLGGKLTKHSWGWPAACMVRKFKRQPAARVHGWRPTARFFKHIAQISEDAQTRKEHASKVWVYDYCWFQVSNFFNCVA